MHVKLYMHVNYQTCSALACTNVALHRPTFPARHIHHAHEPNCLLIAATIDLVDAGLHDDLHQTRLPGHSPAGPGSAWRPSPAGQGLLCGAQSPAAPLLPVTHPWMERLLQELSVDEDEPLEQVCLNLTYEPGRSALVTRLMQTVVPCG